jgi:hypothetical protein
MPCSAHRHASATKNMSFLKKFLKCVEHIVARSNPSQIPSFLGLTSRLGLHNFEHCIQFSCILECLELDLVGVYCLIVGLTNL